MTRMGTQCQKKIILPPLCMPPCGFPQPCCQPNFCMPPPCFPCCPPGYPQCCPCPPPCCPPPCPPCPQQPCCPQPCCQAPVCPTCPQLPQQSQQSCGGGNPCKAKCNCCGGRSTLICVPRGCPPPCCPCPPPACPPPCCRQNNQCCGGDSSSVTDKPASFNNCNFYCTELPKGFGNGGNIPPIPNTSPVTEDECISQPSASPSGGFNSDPCLNRAAGDDQLAPIPRNSDNAWCYDPCAPCIPPKSRTGGRGGGGGVTGRRGRGRGRGRGRRPKSRSRQSPSRPRYHSSLGECYPCDDDESCSAYDQDVDLDQCGFQNTVNPDDEFYVCNCDELHPNSTNRPRPNVQMQNSRPRDGNNMLSRRSHPPPPFMCEDKLCRECKLRYYETLEKSRSGLTAPSFYKNCPCQATATQTSVTVSTQSSTMYRQCTTNNTTTSEFDHGEICSSNNIMTMTTIRGIKMIKNNCDIINNNNNKNLLQSLKNEEKMKNDTLLKTVVKGKVKKGETIGKRVDEHNQNIKKSDQSEAKKSDPYGGGTKQIPKTVDDTHSKSPPIEMITNVNKNKITTAPAATKTVNLDNSNEKDKEKEKTVTVNRQGRKRSPNSNNIKGKKTTNSGTDVGKIKGKNGKSPRSKFHKDNENKVKFPIAATAPASQIRQVQQTSANPRSKSRSKNHPRAKTENNNNNNNGSCISRKNRRPVSFDIDKDADTDQFTSIMSARNNTVCSTATAIPPMSTLNIFGPNVPENASSDFMSAPPTSISQPPGIPHDLVRTQSGPLVQTQNEFFAHSSKANRRKRRAISCDSEGKRQPLVKEPEKKGKETADQGVKECSNKNKMKNSLNEKSKGHKNEQNAKHEEKKEKALVTLPKTPIWSPSILCKIDHEITERRHNMNGMEGHVTFAQQNYCVMTCFLEGGTRSPRCQYERNINGKNCPAPVIIIPPSPANPGQWKNYDFNSTPSDHLTGCVGGCPFSYTAPKTPILQSSIQGASDQQGIQRQGQYPIMTPTSGVSSRCTSPCFPYCSPAAASAGSTGATGSIPCPMLSSNQSFGRPGSPFSYCCSPAFCINGNNENKSRQKSKSRSRSKSPYSYENTRAAPPPLPPKKGRRLFKTASRSLSGSRSQSQNSLRGSKSRSRSKTALTAANSRTQVTCVYPPLQNPAACCFPFPGMNTGSCIPSPHCFLPACPYLIQTMKINGTKKKGQRSKSSSRSASRSTSRTRLRERKSQSRPTSRTSSKTKLSRGKGSRKGLKSAEPSLAVCCIPPPPCINPCQSPCPCPMNNFPMNPCGLCCPGPNCPPKHPWKCINPCKCKFNNKARNNNNNNGKQKNNSKKTTKKSSRPRTRDKDRTPYVSRPNSNPRFPNLHLPSPTSSRSRMPLPPHSTLVQNPNQNPNSSKTRLPPILVKPNNEVSTFSSSPTSDIGPPPPIQPRKELTKLPNIFRPSSPTSPGTKPPTNRSRKKLPPPNPTESTMTPPYGLKPPSPNPNQNPNSSKTRLPLISPPKTPRKTETPTNKSPTPPESYFTFKPWLPLKDQNNNDLNAARRKRKAKRRLSSPEKNTFETLPIKGACCDPCCCCCDPCLTNTLTNNITCFDNINSRLNRHRTRIDSNCC